jgi:hypothetical protein
LTAAAAHWRRAAVRESTAVAVAALAGVLELKALADGAPTAAAATAAAAAAAAAAAVVAAADLELLRRLLLHHVIMLRAALLHHLLRLLLLLELLSTAVAHLHLATRHVCEVATLAVAAVALRLELASRTRRTGGGGEFVSSIGA